jgi:hypothetical protein
VLEAMSEHEMMNLLPRVMTGEEKLWCDEMRNLNVFRHTRHKVLFSRLDEVFEFLGMGVETS